MKRVNSILIMLVIAGNVLGQSLNSGGEKQKINLLSPPVMSGVQLKYPDANKTFNKKGGKSAESAWFNYAAAKQKKIGATGNLFGEYLFPDNTVNIYYYNYGLAPASIHAISVVLDPTDKIFYDANNPQANYTWADRFRVDTVGILCLYDRRVPNAVDTLLVEVATDVSGPLYYFTGMSANYGSDTVMFLGLKRDAKLNYLRPATNAKVITKKIPMTSATQYDTIAGGWNYIKVPLPEAEFTTSSSLAIATFRFIPGYTWDKTKILNQQLNNFRFLSYQENGANTYVSYTPGNYNISEILTSEAVYNTASLFYQNSIYIPSIAFNNQFSLQNHCVDFKLTKSTSEKVSGDLRYDNKNSSPFIYTKVKLRDTQNKLIDSTQTDENGYYSFKNDIAAGNYTIEPELKYWGGVNPVDALLINKSYIGLYDIPGLPQLKKLAADVNYDTKINPVDALLIQKRYVKLLDTFKAGDWIMDDNKVNFSGQDIKKNIKLICRGDVDGSFAPCLPVSSPAAGTCIASQYQIVWRWNGVQGATGYKYNTTNNYKTAKDNGASISYIQTGLKCYTSYTLYVWAYNSCGNNSVALNLAQKTTMCPFVCGGSLIDTRDLKEYKTVQIGTQCWMAENLNIGTVFYSPTNNGKIEKSCLSHNNGYCDKYGGLYTWDEMMNYTTNEGTQGICPSGWHIPSHNDWTTLERAVCSSSTCETDFPYDKTTKDYRGTDEGSKLKATVDWVPSNSGVKPTNESGFTALPGGYTNKDGNSSGMWFQAYFWTSSDGPPGWKDYAWYRKLDFDVSKVYRYDIFWITKPCQLSVRCVKD